MSENMADKMKRKISAKNATAMVLFGAIILVFVFFGLPGKLGAGVGSIAQVNNTLISLADFQDEENRIMQYYQNMFGSSMDLGPQRQMLREQALQTLVRNELISQAARKEGIYATDPEVRDIIVKDIPVFQENGQFQRERYEGYLAAVHSNPGDFENKIRKDIMNVRVRHLFEIAGRPNGIEQKKAEELRRFKLNIAFVKIDQEQLSKSTSKEKADELIKSLDAALGKGDEAALSNLMKEAKLNWEETGLVDLAAETYPKITSAVAVNAIADLTKAQPLLSHLVRDGNSKYILKLKESKMLDSAAIDAKAVEFMEKRRGDGLFENWMGQFRAKSDVTMNTKLLKM